MGLSMSLVLVLVSAESEQRGRREGERRGDGGTSEKGKILKLGRKGWEDSDSGCLCRWACISVHGRARELHS